ncbi:uncharacterized protein LOC107883002 [Acyrthosiphon pisum]|uniref:MULE transposase domain-containing protein n=1 Tax=Acyrthosiphon pisum TaxID=7029 RepID=A0A8R2H6F9_ACYPI|nr:uncharacterized protein LOC107883002 [Acyrthosiphon pisum]|eukprot:XP_016657784.1 PREDICTED: uncharacterized protein LOC107883002 [Acyrthosiphon pisum]
MDGTFSTAPTGFNQVYIIHVKMGSVTIPLVYILLQNKTKQTYTEMLSVICAKYPNCKMVQITIDFEKAVVLAIEKVLPKVKIHCCYFHLCQSVWRKIQEYGLVKKYKDKQFQRDVAMITGLAFLPVNYVKKGMDILYEKFQNQDADQILTYFDTTYVNGRYRNKKNVELKYILTRTAPLFPPSIWNVFELTKAGIGRTNNISEGWNNKFTTLVRINHLNIWLFIEALQMS